MHQRVKDWFLLVLVNLMWAAQFPAYKVASEAMGPVTITAFCFVFASLVLLPFVAFKRKTFHAAFSGAKRRDFLMIGVLGLVPASAFMAWGTERSTASNAAILSLSVPLITSLLAWTVLRERLTRLWWASLAISLIGVLVLSDVDLNQATFAESRFVLGNVLLLGACTSSSIYNVYSKKLLCSVSQREVLFYGYVIAAVISIMLSLWAEPSSWNQFSRYGWQVWVSLLVLSFLSWGIAMLLWMNLLTRLDVSQASISIYLLPILGLLVSFGALGEKLTPTMWVGGVLTLAGTILATWPEKLHE